MQHGVENTPLHGKYDSERPYVMSLGMAFFGIQEVFFFKTNQVLTEFQRLFDCEIV